MITFNYDLIVERALYERGIWKPKDGYGITFKGSPKIARAHSSRSGVCIYKLHGSLNWENDLKLQCFYDDKTPIFRGYPQEGSKSYPRYQGKHLGLWILPSFIKQFAVPELLNVWEGAFRAIRESQQLIVIGYSLPKRIRLHACYWAPLTSHRSD